VTADGHVLDERSGEEWRWPGQLRPFVLDEPAPLTDLRLELRAGGVLAQVELLTDCAGVVRGVAGVSPCESIWVRREKIRRANQTY
jgi:hypothetical protein